MTTHLLANDNYSVLVSEAGTGYSRWRDLAVTRWREDPTADALGFFVFLRDVEDGTVWSAGYQPSGREPDRYEVSFSEERARIIRRDGPLQTATDILVAPNDDAEVRRVSITNEGKSSREIEVTSYAEVVLATPAADAAHPAFSKMFVQTEFDAAGGTLLATRRSREPNERSLWMFHVSMVEGEAPGVLQFETDRARFLGRGRDLRSALSIVDARPLSGTQGTVLDPIVALRRRVRVLPGATARVTFWSGVAASRMEALAVAGKCRDAAWFERMERSAADRAQVSLGSLGIDGEQARLFQRIAGAILYSSPSIRAPRELLARNRSGPSALWAHGISGDLPIVLAEIEDAEQLGLAGQLLRAHDYWRSKRLSVDLVFVNAAPAADSASLQAALEAAVKEAPLRSRGDDASTRGRVFALVGTALDEAGRDALRAAARALFTGRAGSLGDQLSRWHEPARHAAADARPSRHRRTNRGAARSADAGFLQRAGGLRRRSPRVHHRSQGRRMDPGSLDQCDREPRVRIPGLGGRNGDDVVHQCPAEPADPVVQRSGRQRPCGSRLHPRRGLGRALERHAPADSRAGILCGAPWLRLQPVRTHLPRYCVGFPAVRSAVGLRQDIAAQARQPLGPDPPALRHALCRVGARQSAQPDGALHRDGDRCGHLRAPRAQPLEPGFPGPRGVHGHGGARAHEQRRPAGIPGPLRLDGGAGGAPSQGRFVRPRGRGIRPLRRASDPARARAGRGNRGRAVPRTRGIARRRARLHREIPDPRSRRRAQGRHRFLGPNPRYRPGEDAGPLHGRDPERLAPLSNAGLPAVGTHRVLPGKRSVGLPRSTPGCHGIVHGTADRRAGANPACSLAAVRGRRRAALVAPGDRSGHQDAGLGRPDLAALRARALSRGHRGFRDPG